MRRVFWFYGVLFLEVLGEDSIVILEDCLICGVVWRGLVIDLGVRG